MANPLGMGLHAGAQALRFGLYFGLNRAVEWQATRQAAVPRPATTRPLPTQAAILADLTALFMRDAEAVRDGIYPPLGDELASLETFARARRMLADAPEAFRRRQQNETASVLHETDALGYPVYFTQDFHFQSGGYLSETSAQLYDIQVETLFLGGAAPMRREALRPIADVMRGRDQRTVRLLDVACGTGRFLRDVRLAWPALQLTGLDLSPAYIAEARRHFGDLRPADWIAANGEHLPFEDASLDIVTTIFLFHELPADVRRTVAAEMARVLKPGGLLIFIDSLQIGDRPAFDGLLETFPARFHEPYYAHYIGDPLDPLFADAGLAAKAEWTSFLSKVMVRVKL